jgi:hypothetical protein
MRTYRQTDRHDEGNGRFSQFWERAYKCAFGMCQAVEVATKIGNYEYIQKNHAHRSIYHQVSVIVIALLTVNRHPVQILE